MINVGIILGSTRPGRVSEPVGAWVLERAKAFEGWKPEVIDLRDWPLPFFNEKASIMALNGGYSVDLAKAWSKKIAALDAFIIVTPEYNHGYPAVLKNALDYLYPEWNNKAVSFVSYGGVGGARVVEQLRLVVSELQMHDTREAVHIMNVWSALTEQGFKAEEVYEKKLGGLFAQLNWWAKALKTARETVS